MIAFSVSQSASPSYSLSTSASTASSRSSSPSSTLLAFPQDVDSHISLNGETDGDDLFLVDSEAIKGRDTRFTLDFDRRMEMVDLVYAQKDKQGKESMNVSANSNSTHVAADGAECTAKKTLATSSSSISDSISPTPSRSQSTEKQNHLETSRGGDGDAGDRAQQGDYDGKSYVSEQGDAEGLIELMHFDARPPTKISPTIATTIDSQICQQVADISMIKDDKHDEEDQLQGDNAQGQEDDWFQTTVSLMQRDQDQDQDPYGHPGEVSPSEDEKGGSVRGGKRGEEIRKVGDPNLPKNNRVTALEDVSPQEGHSKENPPPPTSPPPTDPRWTILSDNTFSPDLYRSHHDDDDDNNNNNDRTIEDHARELIDTGEHEIVVLISPSGSSFAHHNMLDGDEDEDDIDQYRAHVHEHDHSSPIVVEPETETLKEDLMTSANEEEQPNSKNTVPAETEGPTSASSSSSKLAPSPPIISIESRRSNGPSRLSNLTPTGTATPSPGLSSPSPMDGSLVTPSTAATLIDYSHIVSSFPAPPTVISAIEILHSPTQQSPRTSETKTILKRTSRSLEDLAIVPDSRFSVSLYSDPWSPQSHSSRRKQKSEQEQTVSEESPAAIGSPGNKRRSKSLSHTSTSLHSDAPIASDQEDLEKISRGVQVMGAPRERTQHTEQDEDSHVRSPSCNNSSRWSQDAKEYQVYYPSGVTPSFCSEPLPRVPKEETTVQRQSGIARTRPFTPDLHGTAVLTADRSQAVTISSAGHKKQSHTLGLRQPSTTTSLHRSQSQTPSLVHSSKRSTMSSTASSFGQSVPYPTSRSPSMPLLSPISLAAPHPLKESSPSYDGMRMKRSPSGASSRSKELELAAKQTWAELQNVNEGSSGSEHKAWHRQSLNGGARINGFGVHKEADEDRLEPLSHSSHPRGATTDAHRTIWEDPDDTIMAPRSDLGSAVNQMDERFQSAHQVVMAHHSTQQDHKYIGPRDSNEFHSVGGEHVNFQTLPLTLSPHSHDSLAYRKFDVRVTDCNTSHVDVQYASLSSAESGSVGRSARNFQTNPGPPSGNRTRYNRNSSLSINGEIQSVASGQSPPYSGPRPSILDSVASPHPYAAPAISIKHSASREGLNNLTRMASSWQPVVLEHVAVVWEEDKVVDDETCPICVESLNASFRLPGENSHIVPDCGHTLHEACFVAVYGPMPQSTVARSRPLGLCGVCRQPMMVTEEDEFAGPSQKGASKKIAAMTGMDMPDISRATTNSSSLPVGMGGFFASSSTPSFSPTSSEHDSNGNDAVEPAMSGKSPITANKPDLVRPSITIKPEHNTISRNPGRNGKQGLTCLITIELPSAGNRGQSPAPPLNSTAFPFSERHPTVTLRRTEDNFRAAISTASPLLSPIAISIDPFAHIVKDLQARLVDYPSSGLSQVGRIKLFDILRVRKGSFMLELCVYLFPTALICLSEEKKRSLKSLLGGSKSAESRSANGSRKEKGVLKLKGRIYLKHVKRVIDSTVAGELSLTIAMQDEKLDSFILTFGDRSSHELWKRTLTQAVGDIQGVPISTFTNSSSPGARGTSFSSKLARMGLQDSVVQATHQSPMFGGISPSFADPWSPDGSGLPTSSTVSSVNRESDLAAPLGPVHTPLDLVLAFSLPTAAGSNQSSTPLKLRLIKSTLEFVFSVLGPQDRVSVVTFEVGVGGLVRKTPLLCPGRASGRAKLQAFADRIIDNSEAHHDDENNFEVVTGKEERIDVVTGLNHAFDSILQRKTKNPITGMIVVNESGETIKRTAMDLVLARAEAANIPVHSLGYGQNQDPSGLWLISSHTHGTYTFVKEWYHLRDCLAGCLGGLTSIAITNLKIHLSSGETEFKCKKIYGAPSMVISGDGKSAELQLFELRYGQRLEILVDMEFERSSGHKSASNQGSPLQSNSSSDSGTHSSAAPSSNGLASRETTVKKQIINGRNADDLNRISDDNLIDELPVIELDCSYNDPGTSRTVSRLSYPVLLTVALLPQNQSMAKHTADTAVCRRRFELVASDSITRALLLVSRNNWAQAQRILHETSKVLQSVMSTTMRQLPDHSRGYVSNTGAKREIQGRVLIETLGSILHDMEYLQEGMEEQRELFERDHRNYGAQQALVLRTQKAWTERTATERLYCAEGPKEFLTISRDLAQK